VKTALPKADMCYVAGKMLPNTQQLLSVFTQVVDLGSYHLLTFAVAPLICMPFKQTWVALVLQAGITRKRSLGWQAVSVTEEKIDIRIGFPLHWSQIGLPH